MSRSLLWRHLGWSTPIAVALVTLLDGCGMLSSVLGTDDHEYKTAAPKPVKLEVPPDLVAQTKDDRFAVPDRGAAASGAAATSSTGAAGTAGGAGLASAYGPASAPGAAGATVAGAAAGAPAGTPTIAGMVAPTSSIARIERDGAQRWLAIDASPETTFIGVADFVVTSGMTITTQDASTGVVETGWVERRSGDPESPTNPVGRTLHLLLQSLQSTGLKDRYRFRVERVDAQHSLVFVSQRGLQEVYTSTSRDATTSWEPAPPSPELEAEELQKLLVKLGGVTAPVAPVAPVAVAAPAAAPASAPDPAAAAAAAPSVGRLIKGAGGHTTAIELDQVFERAWRQVGLALDRGGFTIEDRDRIKGLYFVRYIDPEYEATVKANQGWWARLTSSDPKLTAQQFRIALAVDADHTRVMVQTQDGTGDAGATGERILNQINEQLR